MIAIKISEIKDFMNKLLCQEVFDNFLLQEAAIHTSVAYHIDGALLPDFYSEEELEENGLSGLSFMPYGKVRNQCFDLIKGKRTPSYFKFSLLLSPENLKRTLEQIHSSFTESDVSAVFLNIKYQNNVLVVTSGVSYRIFTPDKSLEHEWDALAKRFLKSHEIAYEEL